jgi:LysR family hydrogen peroxide-inducible transcriptional activator
VGELRRRHPRAEPILVEERTDRLVARVAGGALDIGLLAAPVPGGELEAHHLATDEFHLAMPEDHPLAGTGPLPTGVLAGLPMVLLEDGHCLRDQAIDVCASVGASLDGGIQGTSLSTLCQMVAAGLGVTLLPASAIDVEARPGSGLTTRPLRDPSPDRTVVLAWRPSDPRRDLYAAFADALAGPISARCAA